MATVTSDLVTYVPRLLRHGRGRHGAEHWEVDGSLVFADISGFTRLTERLARQGKAGAEEMVTTISEVFTHLLSATQDGGDVLKFGGDALLILYTGPDHAVHACHAAQGMQSRLRQVGSIESSQGRVRLRMSVGVHSATFPVLLTGHDDALELLVVGEPASTTVDMESTADAGEILVSPATAGALDPAWLGARKGDGVLVRRIPAQPPVPLVEQPVEPRDLERFVPRLLRGRLGRDAEEHEHRHVAVSFVHFGGVDDLVQQSGTATAFERVDALTRVVQEATDEYGVLIVCTDIGGDGGKFMLAAGAPDASEDDAGRLLRAAHRIVTADVGIPVRAGVNHGHVFAGDVGAPFRRTYSTMGDAVNLAARVMGKAPFGEVLATTSVVTAAAGRFRTVAVPPFLVKGKTQPVDAQLVGEALSGVSEREHDDRLPFVGREHELVLLQEASARTGTDQPRAVEVVGDVGAGKSRLVAELVATTDLPVVRVTGDPYSQAVAYHVARRLLRRLLDIPLDLGPDAAGLRLADAVDRACPSLRPWLPLLAIPVGARVAATPDVDGTAERFRTTRMRLAVAELVDALTPEAIVVVESVEHVDDASAELIAQTLVAGPARRWLMVLTRRADVERPAWLDADDVETLVLAPLLKHHAAELVAHASEQHPLATHVADAIVERAAGNPLFLLELVRTSSGTGEVAELPGSVEAIIASSLDALAPDDRQALRLLSVLGTSAEHDVVDGVLGDLGVRSDDTSRWRRLSGFVRRTSTELTFTGELARRAAYEGLTYRRRRELHGRVADVLLDGAAGRHGGDDALGLVAWHLTQAGRWAQAWPVAVAAGDSARAGYANTEAVEAYRRALTAAEHLDDLAPGEVAEVAERCGDTSEIAGLYPQASEAYRTARRAALDGAPARRLRLLRKQGVVEERMGRYVAALRWYGRALRLAESMTDVTSAVAELHNAYAGVRYRQGRLRDCLRHAHLAAQLATEVDDLSNRAHAYYLLDAAHTDLGEDEEASRYRDEALPIFERTGDVVGQANVLNNLGIDAFFAGDLDIARELYERSRAVRLVAGDVVGAATADNNIAEILLELGQLDEAEALLRHALRVFRGARYPVGAGLALSNLGVVAMRRGDAREARRGLDEALRIFDELGATGLADEARGRLAALEIDLRSELTLAR